MIHSFKAKEAEKKSNLYSEVSLVIAFLLLGGNVSMIWYMLVERAKRQVHFQKDKIMSVLSPVFSDAKKL